MLCIYGDMYTGKQKYSNIEEVVTYVIYVCILDSLRLETRYLIGFSFNPINKINQSLVDGNEYHFKIFSNIKCPGGL